jgi:tetratricopeptide (TPR) repeat protein
MGAGLVMAALLRPAAPGARAQWQKNQYQMEKEAAQKYLPAPLVAPGRQGGALTPVRIRFYADEDYRAGARWQDRMRGQLADLNQVVGPSFGVRFEAESFRRWTRKSGAGSLDPMIAELQQLDRGQDVDWVVGLVSSLPLVSMSFHELGKAHVLGRHFVLRAMASVAEMQAFNDAFRALEQEDRDKIYNIRQKHKELAVFLHEWAHTLGAFHVEDPTRIMGPGYSQRTSSFSVADAGLIASGLEARLAARGRDIDDVDWGPLRVYVEANRGDWPAGEREQLLAMLRGRRAPPGQAGAAGPPADVVPVVPIPGLIPRPRAASIAGAPAAAPAAPARAPGPTPARGKAAAEGPLDPTARAKLVADARGAQAEAAGRDNRGAFVQAARMYLAAGALTAARDALIAAGDHDGVRDATAELTTQRRRLGLPEPGKGGGAANVPPEAEPRYAQHVEDARWQLYQGKLREVQATVKLGLERFPRAPGLLAVDCELAMRQGRPQQAVTRCRQALAGMDDLPRAHYLLGCALVEVGQPDKGLDEIKRAIALDPKDRNSWESLAELYRLMGRQKEFRKFAADNGGPPAP